MGYIKERNLHSSLKTWLRAQNTMIGMASGSKVWFVDGANGNDNYQGWGDPASAFKTLEKLQANIGVYDVAYIAPAGLGSSGEPAYYTYADGSTTNLDIAAAKGGVALIGIGHAAMVGQPMQVCIKGYETGNYADIDIYAPFCCIENLGFNRGNSAYGIHISGDSAGTYDGWGTSIYNCYFRNVRGSGATGDTGGAIYVEGGAQNTTIERCIFYNCRQGIAAKSGTSVTEGLIIRDCTFRASSAANVAVDIYLYFQGQNYTEIHDIFIAHDVPSYSGGHGACIVAAGGAEIGQISRVYALDTDGSVHASTGTIARVPTTMGTSDIWCGDQTNPAAN